MKNEAGNAPITFEEIVMAMIKLITARVCCRQPISHSNVHMMCFYIIIVVLYYIIIVIYLTLVVQDDDILSGMQCVSL